MRIKVLLVVLVAAFTVGCAAKMLPSQEPRQVSPLKFASNEWRVPSQAIVIADSSGTTYMSGSFPYIKAMTQSFVKAMPDGNTAAKYRGNYDASLIGFSGFDRILSPLAPFDRGALGSKANSLRVLGDLAGYGGTTPLDVVFEEVQESLKTKSGTAAVVIFSDGLPDDPELTMENAQMLVKKYSEQVCFHTVHFGRSKDEGENKQGAAFLKKLSALTSCGTAENLSGTWGAENLMKFVHGVFAGEAPRARAVDPCEGRIVLRGVEFEFDSAKLTGTSSVVLDVAAEELGRCPKIPIQVDGHTDSVGADAYNQALGQRRADSVKRYFVGNGVSSGRLETRSFGESKPVSSNDTDDGRRMNRRVELHPVQ
jgi:outer membrane protein OmpA-like peptidoglycan-associated protein